MGRLASIALLVALLVALSVDSARMTARTTTVSYSTIVIRDFFAADVHQETFAAHNNAKRFSREAQDCDPTGEVPYAMNMITSLGGGEAFMDVSGTMVRKAKGFNVTDTGLATFEDTRDAVNTTLNAAALRLGAARPFPFDEATTNQLHDRQGRVRRQVRPRPRGRGRGHLSPAATRIVDDLIFDRNNRRTDHVSLRERASTDYLVQFADQQRAGGRLNRQRTDSYITVTRDRTVAEQLAADTRARQERVRAISSSSSSSSYETRTTLDSRTTTPADYRALADRISDVNSGMSIGARIGLFAATTNGARIITALKAVGTLGGAAILFDIVQRIGALIHGDNNDKVTAAVEVLLKEAKQNKDSDEVLNANFERLSTMEELEDEIESHRFDVVAFGGVGRDLRDIIETKLTLIQQAKAGWIHNDAALPNMWNDIRLGEPDVDPDWNPETVGAKAAYDSDSDTIFITFPTTCQPAEPSVAAATVNHDTTTRRPLAEATKHPWTGPREGHKVAFEKANITADEVIIKEAEDVQAMPNSSFNLDAIIGTVVGVALALALAFGVSCYCKRKRSRTPAGIALVNINPASNNAARPAEGWMPEWARQARQPSAPAFEP